MMGCVHSQETNSAANWSKIDCASSFKASKLIYRMLFVISHRGKIMCYMLDLLGLKLAVEDLNVVYLSYLRPKFK